DLARLDPAVQDVGQERENVRTGRCRAATHADVLPEGHSHWNRVFLGNADAADGTARANDIHCGEHRLLESDAFQHGMRAKAAGELADVFHRSIAWLTDDIRCAERFAERDAVGMMAEENDLLGAAAPSGDDAAQTDRPVTNHRRRF